MNEQLDSAREFCNPGCSVFCSEHGTDIGGIVPTFFMEEESFIPVKIGRAGQMLRPGDHIVVSDPASIVHHGIFVGTGEFKDEVIDFGPLEEFAITTALQSVRGVVRKTDVTEFCGKNMVLVVVKHKEYESEEQRKRVVEGAYSMLRGTPPDYLLPFYNCEVFAWCLWEERYVSPAKCREWDNVTNSFLTDYWFRHPATSRKHRHSILCQ